MPRTFDLRQPPMDHNPLANLLDFSNIDATVAQAGSLIQGFITSSLEGIIDLIEEMTGLDLSALADMLAGLDFSSPAAFLLSLVEAMLELPEVLLQLLSGLVEMLVTLPSQIQELLRGLLQMLTEMTGIDLNVFLPLLDLLNLDLSSPIAFLDSLMTVIMSVPHILSEIATNIIYEITELTGIDLSFLLPILDLLDLDMSNPVAFLASFVTSIFSIPEVAVQLVNDIIQLLINLPETLTSFLDVIVDLLSSIPAMLTDLLGSLIYQLTEATGIDLSSFLTLLDLINFDFTSPEAFLESLINAIGSIPIVIEQLLFSILDALGASPEALDKMLTDLIDTLATIPETLANLLDTLISTLMSTPDLLLSLLNSLINLLVSAPDIMETLLESLIHLLMSLPSMIASLAQTLVSAGVGLLGPNSPLNALNIFGTLGSGLFGAVPIGSLVDKIINIVPLGGLFKPGSIAPGGGWFTDLLDLGGGSGSAKVTADGTKHGLLGVTIPVVSGQVLDLSAKTKWSGLTSSGGSPITFGLKSLFGDTPVGNTTIGSVTSPGATGSQTLSGQYTVPASGVDSIRLRLGVNGNATAGTVWFSSITGGQPGQIEQDWVTNLIPQFDGILGIFGLNHLSDLIGLIPSTINDLWTQAIEVIINPLGVLSDVVARLTSQGTIDAAIEAVEGLPIVGGTIAEFFDAIDEIFGTALSGQAMATDAQGDVNDLTHNLLTAPAGVMGALPQSSVTNLPGDLGNRLTLSGGTGWTDWSQRMYQAFSGGQFSGVMPSNSQMFNTFIDFYSVLSQSGANYANLNRNQTENTQTKQIMAGQVVTPINSLIASIKSWFDAHF